MTELQAQGRNGGILENKYSQLNRKILYSDMGFYILSITTLKYRIFRDGHLVKVRVYSQYILKWKGLVLSCSPDFDFIFIKYHKLLKGDYFVQK